MRRCVVAGGVNECHNKCHRLNCDYSLGCAMGSVLMCILSVD